MYSNHLVAGISIFGYPEKRFDTSGKSGALIHHLAIFETATALPGCELFGAIKNPYLQLKLHWLARRQ